MPISFDRKIILEDGTSYEGKGFGYIKESILELVFNTSMVGYQEILSDPSYTDQAVVMTYPLIGNYGINEEDFESQRPTIGGFIVREYNDTPSNFRSSKTLDEVMKNYGIVGVSGVDTRKLTRKIREYGSCKVLITDINTTIEEGLAKLKEYPFPTDQVARVSSKEIYKADMLTPVDFKNTGKKVHIVAIDCGMKQNITRFFMQKETRVTIVPWDTSAEKIKSLAPDGIFISNGPGDPTDCKPLIETVKKLRGYVPIFGICLGNQIISLAYGARTYKLKFGHRGGNHPVMNLETGKIEITSQNHSYAVDEETLVGTKLKVTHRNILDNTIEGVECKEEKVFSVQYHPESAPGPQDSAYLFDKFINMIKENQNA